MDKHFSYWQNEVSVDLFDYWHINNTQHIAALKIILNYIAHNNHKSILDVGAGTGLFYSLIKSNAPKNYANIVKYQGIDITEKFVTAARENGIPMIQGNSDELPFEDNSFDVVVAFDLLNHLYDYRPTIKEMVRVAKKQIIFKMFKDSTENLNFISPSDRDNIIGWYPGPWKPGKLPATCPVPGWYPNRTSHNKLIAIKKNHKIHNSPLGFYYEDKFDENGNPTCIFHHYSYETLKSFIHSLNCGDFGYVSTPDFDETYNKNKSEVESNAEKYGTIPAKGAFLTIYYCDLGDKNG